MRSYRLNIVSYKEHENSLSLKCVLSSIKEPPLQFIVNPTGLKEEKIVISLHYKGAKDKYHHGAITDIKRFAANGLV